MEFIAQLLSNNCLIEFVSEVTWFDWSLIEFSDMKWSRLVN